MEGEGNDAMKAVMGCVFLDYVSTFAFAERSFRLAGWYTEAITVFILSKIFKRYSNLFLIIVHF